MEIKTPIFKRVPPGDRWVEIDGDQNRIFPTLTEALEFYFQKTKGRQYFVDAIAGTVSYVIQEADPEPIIRQFSIYDDDI
jgi:hypothetical protein